VTRGSYSLLAFLSSLIAWFLWGLDLGAVRVLGCLDPAGVAPVDTKRGKVLVG